MDTQNYSNLHADQYEHLAEMSDQARTRLEQIPEVEGEMVGERLKDGGEAAGSASTSRRLRPAPSLSLSSNDDQNSVHGLYTLDVSIPRASLITKSTEDSDDESVHSSVSPSRVPLPPTPSAPKTPSTPSPTTSQTQEAPPPNAFTGPATSELLRVPFVLRQSKSHQSSLDTNTQVSHLHTYNSPGTSTTTLRPPDEDIDGAITETMPMPEGAALVVQAIQEKKMGMDPDMDMDLESQNTGNKEKKGNSSSTPSSPTITPTRSSEVDPNFDPQYEVSLEAKEDPKNLSKFRKWLVVLLICTAAFCVTCASSAAGPAEPAEASAFHVARETTILGISLFVLGLGIGPLFQGPLSEFYGRNAVYWTSFGLFWAGGWGVTFAPNIGVFLAFRFITGFSGSAFFSVVGGTLSDLFINEEVSTPLSVYTLSPFIGPILGPVISGFINQNTDWRWTYRFLQIWGFGEMIAIVVLIPETYVPIILKRKAAALRRSTGNNMWWSPLERLEALENRSLASAIAKSGWRPIQLMIAERMALLLDLWNALIIGVLYLTFQAFPVIFEKGHGFNTQETGLTFLGIGLGMCIAMACQPLWNIYFKKQYVKHNGDPPPEIRLVPGMPGGILVFISLMWLAFTTYPSVPFIVPIIASIPFGTGIIFVFTSTFSYLVTAYRPLAASALSGNAALRSSFAAGFPLFAPAMYARLGTVGATALLGGLTGLMAPLPFIFYRYGARIRAQSRFAIA